MVGDYATLMRERPVFISVVAGKTIGYFKRTFGADAAIVRAMPNTPAAVSRAISVLVASPEVDAIQRKVCDVLMSAVGQVAWVDDEAVMDAVTAVSGSGPAYVFLLAEALAEAGVRAGLPAELAARLARATVAGAGIMLEQRPESPATMRENVTSPGGTTAAALKVLMSEHGLSTLMREAVEAATRRSGELAGS
jgi:pyrroline-5-carboxylate reductase